MQTVEETYRPRGNISRLFDCAEPEVILGGPAGTGKSRGNLEYLNYWAMNYPGCRLLMTRKTRRSLTESGMVTFEQKVLHPAQGVHFTSSKQQYQYPNGSILAVAGLDKPSKIMSSEWDIIYVQEATELEEEDWEMCGIRIRNGRLPVQQMIGDCNPGPATHWIKQRARDHKTLLLDTRHEDNPVLFTDTGDITPEGERYLGKLDQLTGVRYKRYRKGLWVSAEGMVYEDSWDPMLNIVKKEPIPLEWPRFLAVDFGFTHPFVCLWAAQDPDGRLIVYRQIYKTKVLVEDHAREIRRLSRWGEQGGDPLPRAIICDHDAEDRATLERHLGLMTIRAQKNVSAGIQAVASRFRVAGDGRPRVMVQRDSRLNCDRELADAKQPTCLEEEPESYIWTPPGNGVGHKEQPLKENDHACFIAGTLIETAQGYIPIERIKIGDRVLTRNGYRRVKDAGLTHQNARVLTMRLGDGTTLTGTPNHPIWVENSGFVPLHSVSSSDIIRVWKNQQLLHTTALTTVGIPMGATGQNRTTSVLFRAIGGVATVTSMPMYGNQSTGQSPKITLSITSMEIPSTMISATLLVSHKKSMCCDTEGTIPSAELKSGMMRGLRDPRKAHIDGKKRMRALPACRSMVGAPLLPEYPLNALANNAEKHSRALYMERKSVFARQGVTNDIALSMVSSQNNAPALAAERHSWSTIDGRVLNAVPSHVLSITEEEHRQPVYNLTVENPDGEGEYFANGVLVHNCDALRYLICHFDLIPSDVKYSNRVY